MGGDLLLAAEQLSACGAGVRAVVIRGAGAHFSAGGNPHAHKGGAPLAAAAAGPVPEADRMAVMAGQDPQAVLSVLRRLFAETRLLDVEPSLAPSAMQEAA